MKERVRCPFTVSNEECHCEARGINRQSARLDQQAADRFKMLRKHFPKLDDIELGSQEAQGEMVKSLIQQSLELDIQALNKCNEISRWEKAKLKFRNRTFFR